MARGEELDKHELPGDERRFSQGMTKVAISLSECKLRFLKICSVSCEDGPRTLEVVNNRQ